MAGQRYTTDGSLRRPMNLSGYTGPQAPMGVPDMVTHRRPGSFDWQLAALQNDMQGRFNYGNWDITHPEINARVSFARRDAAEKEAIRAQVERDNAQRQYFANQNTDPYNKRGFGPLSLQAGLNF